MRDERRRSAGRCRSRRTPNCCAPTSTVTRTPSANWSGGTATGSGRWRCAPSATARRPPTPSRMPCSPRTGPPPGSAATPPSPPGCTASWSTPAWTGSAAARPTRPCRCRTAAAAPDGSLIGGVEPAAPVARPRHRAGRAGCPGRTARRAARRPRPRRRAGLPGRRGRRDPRGRRGHHQEPVRPRPGPDGDRAGPPAPAGDDRHAGRTASAGNRRVRPPSHPHRELRRTRHSGPPGRTRARGRAGDRGRVQRGRHRPAGGLRRRRTGRHTGRGRGGRPGRRRSRLARRVRRAHRGHGGRRGRAARAGRPWTSRCRRTWYAGSTPHSPSCRRSPDRHPGPGRHATLVAVPGGTWSPYR